MLSLVAALLLTVVPQNNTTHEEKKCMIKVEESESGMRDCILSRTVFDDGDSLVMMKIIDGPTLAFVGYWVGTKMTLTNLYMATSYGQLEEFAIQPIGNCTKEVDLISCAAMLENGTIVLGVVGN